MSMGRNTTARLFFVQASSNRQQEGVVVGATDALITIEFDDAVEVLPERGGEVHLAVDGRLLNTTVHRVDGNLVTVVCPAGVELRDVPDVLPARAGFATTWRAADGRPLAAWVLEMSVRSARILAVRDEQLRVGTQVTLDLDGQRVRCTIDQLVAHRHSEHAIYQLRFSLADAAAASPITRLLGALRSAAAVGSNQRVLVAA